LAELLIFQDGKLQNEFSYWYSLIGILLLVFSYWYSLIGTRIKVLQRFVNRSNGGLLEITSIFPLILSKRFNRETETFEVQGSSRSGGLLSVYDFKKT